jgi:HSP20 family protein
MNLVSWTPFRDMEGFFEWPQSLMSPRLRSSVELEKAFDWRPSVDISETKKHYLIKVELPEVDKDDVDVSVENGLLTISGERNFKKEEDTETQHRVECVYGRFSRSFTLPGDIDESAISAKSKDGILRVCVPKTHETKDEPVKIEVH